eukprot:11228283-Lingulodinium_polyedra.AAC.2
MQSIERSDGPWEEGYDSDGELGPFLDAVVDQGGVDVEGEDDGLPDSMVVVGSGSGNTTNTNGEVTSPDWFLSDEQINVLKVDALKEAIKMRGVVPKGRKDELRVMLKQCMEKGMGIVEGVTKDMHHVNLSLHPSTIKRVSISCLHVFKGFIGLRSLGKCLTKQLRGKGWTNYNTWKLPTR